MLRQASAVPRSSEPSALLLQLNKIISSPNQSLAPVSSSNPFQLSQIELGGGRSTRKHEAIRSPTQIL